MGGSTATASDGRATGRSPPEAAPSFPTRAELGYGARLACPDSSREPAGRTVRLPAVSLSTLSAILARCTARPDRARARLPYGTKSPHLSGDSAFDRPGPD